MAIDDDLIILRYLLFACTAGSTRGREMNDYRPRTLSNKGSSVLISYRRSLVSTTARLLLENLSMFFHFRISLDHRLLFVSFPFHFKFSVSPDSIWRRPALRLGSFNINMNPSLTSFWPALEPLPPHPSPGPRPRSMTASPNLAHSRPKDPFLIHLCTSPARPHDQRYLNAYFHGHLNR